MSSPDELRRTFNNNLKRDLKKHLELGAAAKKLRDHHGEGEFHAALVGLFDFHKLQVDGLSAQIKEFRGSCTHSWRYDYTGRHGSDKGDEYYSCTICGTQERR